MSGHPPVVLFVYDRPEHTRQVLDSIERDGIRELTVYSDGPATTAAAADAVDAVRRIVREHPGLDVRLVERPGNLGLARSIMEGVSDALEGWDRVIVIEDDCVVLPGFREFMSRALERYAGDDRVGCVSGYGPPGVERPADYRADGYFTGRISSWGWGTWRDAWSLLRDDWDALRAEALAAGPELLARAGPDLERWLEPEFAMRVGRDAWTPLWLFPLLLEGKRTLWPFRSYVHSIGLDGTGVHPIRASVAAPGTPVPPAGFRFPDPGQETPPAVLERFHSGIARPGPRPLRERLRDRVRRLPVVWQTYLRVRDALGLEPRGSREVYRRLARHEERVGRREPGAFEFPFGPLEYVDARSLRYQYQEIFVRGLYDVRLYAPRPRILDCGGNVGLSVVRFKQRHPDAEVTVFEADPDLVAVLRRNVERLGLEDVTIVPAAAWTEEGDVPFAADAADAGRVVAAEGSPAAEAAAAAGPATVPAVRLADWVDGPVDLLKLDIEGAELPVLRDLASSGRLERVRHLICELHGRAGDDLAALAGLLQEAGYRLTLDRGRSAPDLPGPGLDTPFAGLPDGKYLAHIYAWREG